ncbi:tetraspanin-17 isoform X2 [Oryzias latipes]|uniref:tetraspanin-17 isoform X2 n=1 Tax=Oryzias latipes TaxID=8090 RepID=UPI0009DA7510|nr:tetraspanin-17 isoform X2 [Oryzias latipes]
METSNLEYRSPLAAAFQSPHPSSCLASQTATTIPGRMSRKRRHFKGTEVSCCVKYILFGFNIIFWLLGAAFLSIGLWAWAEKGVLSNISSITDLGGLDPVWLFIVVGGVMFILGFAGCIGALRENTVLLKFFSVFLGLIFFLELTTGILAYVFKDWIKDQLNLFINNNVKAYRDDIDLQNLIDFAQEYFSSGGRAGRPKTEGLGGSIPALLSQLLPPERGQPAAHHPPRGWAKCGEEFPHCGINKSK